MRLTTSDRGATKKTAYTVLDLGTGPLDTLPRLTPYALAYPTDKQIDLPTGWYYTEFPSPVPQGAPMPAGYPFTLQGAYGTLRVDAANMRDAKGQLVQVYPNPTVCLTPDYNCYAIIPVAPLQPQTLYTVQARGSVGTTPFSHTWQFTTGSERAAGSVSLPRP